MKLSIDWILLATTSSFAVVATLAPMAVTAENTFEFSGQINRALLFADDGTQSKGFFVDNSNSNTRIRLSGTREVSQNLSAGFLLESSYSSNPSDTVSFENSSITATLDERHIDIFLKGVFGKLSLGQGNGAANGGMETDLSGTSIVGSSDVAEIGGTFGFKNTDGTDGPLIVDTIDNLDFESRYDRLRYDTPALGPIKLAISAGAKEGNEVYEVSLRPDVKLSAGKLEAIVGYSVEKRGGTAGSQTTIGGSISYVMENGLSATLALGNRDNDNPNSDAKKFMYAKLGYETGLHAFSIDVGLAKDFDRNGDDSAAYGTAYVYKAAKWLELYAGAKLHRLDRSGTDFENATFAMAGTRVTF